MLLPGRARLATRGSDGVPPCIGHHNRDGGVLLGRQCRRVARRNQQIDIARHYFFELRPQESDLSLRGTTLENKVHAN